MTVPGLKAMIERSETKFHYESRSSSNDKIRTKSFPLEASFDVCPRWPSAAEAEVTVLCTPLPHNAHHCLNIKTIFREEEDGSSTRVSRSRNGFCVFVSINQRPCVHLLCPTPPTFNPASVQWWLADVQPKWGGGGFLVRKHLFDSRKPLVPILPES